MVQVERDLWRSSGPFLPAQTGPHGPCCPGPRPDFFSLFPQVETPQPLWATRASAQSLSQCKTVSWCSEGMPCVSVCTHGLWSWHWAPLVSSFRPFLKTGVIFAFLQCSGTSLSHHDHPKMFNMVPRHSFVRQVWMYTNSLLWCVSLYVLIVGILDCDPQLQLVLRFICIPLSHFDKNWTTPLPGKYKALKLLPHATGLRQWNNT